MPKKFFLYYQEIQNQWAAFFPKPATNGNVCSSPNISSAEELEILVFLLLSFYFLIRFKNRNKLGRWIFFTLIYLDLF